MITHKDLRVWQMSIDFATYIYNITKEFPKDELFGLVSQMRRAVVSVPSNIAEGYARGTNKEILHFLRISSGSMSELDTQILLSYQLGYISKEHYEVAINHHTSIWKSLNALISTIKNRIDVNSDPEAPQTTKPLNPQND